ncbi:MAG TPA: ABC transporter permease [Gryllotalpicola sp.]
MTTVHEDPAGTRSGARSGVRMPRVRRPGWLRLRDTRAALPFAIILAIYIVMALAPSWFVHAPALSSDLSARLLPPGTVRDGVTHWLGTDQLGRDLLNRLVYGTRISLAIAFSAVLCAGAFGTFLGVIAGVARGGVAAIIMRVADVVLSIPFFLLAILTVVALGPSLINVVICLTLVRWPRYTRVAYAQTLEAQGKEFVRSAQAIGASGPWIVWRHILPEVLPSVIVVATLELGTMVIYEASLSFVGLGVQPPTPSWGAMLSDGREYISTAWWLTTFPGVALFILVLSVNLLGDYVRDRLDPTEQGRSR